MIESPRQRIGARAVALLLDEAEEPIFALDLEGTILHANAAAARVVGRHRPHLIGKPLAALVDVHDRRKVRTAFTTVGSVPVTLDVTLEASGADARLTLRQVPGVRPPTLSARLGTERPALPPPMPDVSAVLDRFFLRFPHGVIGLSRERRVIFGNARARQLLGERAFRIGRVLSSPVVGEFAERVVLLPAVAQTAHIELPDGRVLRASGLGPRGTEPAILVLEDITAEERHDRVMREFVRNAAHQLRTPLTGIAAAVEVLQAGGKEDPEVRDRFLGHVEVHAGRLIRIARGLLVLARAQAGEAMRLEFVELRPLLDELAAQSQPQPGVELSIECDSALAVLAERDLVHEVLAALVENAVHHTREGSIRMSAAEADGRVAISVTDTGGTGVLPEHRERIFEPFYRPDASGAGFGLGLAIAAQATKAMEGELTVEHAERGARFTIRLPSGRILS